ncbi:MAG: 4'-phosphopantetheinyl transferase superfamily protein [Desulfobacterales bacterium]|nr:4'-phosphopantetheinyl transferase superfamily protein [Desulfobacterales bacterium]
MSRALTGAVLSRRLSCGPGELRLSRSKTGRPGFSHGSGPLELDFNISHARDLVVCAVTDRGRVGIDIEHVKRRVNLDIARRFFSVRETAELENAPKAVQAEMFLQLWTLKESYVKAVGQGISRLPLGEFGFDLGGKRFFAQGAARRPGSWKFCTGGFHGEYHMALALEGPVVPPLEIPIMKWEGETGFSPREKWTYDIIK